jgi:AcrR family transcriptional regulator
MTGTTRPGGRTARTKEAVFEAVALIAEREVHNIAMTDIAERAGVAATSLYRRWGDIRVLVMEVAVKELIREHPLPNTGRFAETSTSGRETSLKALQPRGLLLPRVDRNYDASRDSRDGTRRGADAARDANHHDAGTCTRARRKTPSTSEVLDHLLAPLYVRALFGLARRRSFRGKSG